MPHQISLSNFGEGISNLERVDDDSFPDSYENPDWLRERYCERDQSVFQIANSVGQPTGVIVKWLVKHGIESYSNLREEMEEPPKSKYWFVQEYWAGERTLSDIGDELGRSASVVGSWMDYYGIERRPRGRRSILETAPHINPDWLHMQYHEYKRDPVNIATQLSVSANTVRRWMDNLGIPRRTYSTDGDYSGTYYGSMWPDAREKAKEKDGYECRNCGMTESEHYEVYGHDLHVHHVRPFRTFDDPEIAHRLSNLMTVCCSCHKSLEANPQK
ncbi:HNH endonuclease [Halorubrum sp. AD140]|uniref:HNH endonuclease n=1 Tax=Halorubrum sp. AD140 TaxID=3050073 RepID=UPI002ACD03D0|nr:HNH endonuclease [Halorubrum sp. AD140]MDZ5811545.1 HNH endonuclease [Halorubrum sp. AD140]